MSLDLFQQETNERLTALRPVQNVDPGMFDGFIRGTGMATMKGFAKAGRAIDLLGSVGPIVQDAFTGGTEAQDKYFAEHDAIYGRAVDYWTPRSTEIGSAAEVMGNLLSVIPQVIVSPALAVGTTQLGTAEDLVNAGVTSGKANVVGAIQGAGLGVGIWMPILGQNLWQRALIGGAGFNLAQGVVTRAASGLILEDTPAKDMFKAFDGEALTLDVLLGLAFGSLAHLSPQQRTQGKEVWGRIQTWAENLSPSEKASISTLREGQHLNVDSTPGKPVGTPDIEAHVERMRTAIDQLATDQPVAVEEITVPRRVPEEVPEIQQLREELSDATTSRAAAEEAGDQATARQWDGEIQRINRELTEKTTTVLEEVNRPVDDQPRFIPDVERVREAETTMRAMVAEAEVVRAEEGLPPPPQEAPRVTQSVRRTIEEELARAGRPAEEAAAGAALWDAFYTTMATRIGTTAEDLWARFPLARITNEMPGGEALKQGLRPALKPDPTVEDIHAIADQKKIKWDNDQRFMKMTEELTGKKHLDELNQDERRAVYEHLARRDTLFQSEWYSSALGEGIAKLNMKAASAKGWLDALKGLQGKGVKADEIKWSGVEEWLQLQEGKITKEQVQEFLTNNGVKVEEVTLGGDNSPNLGDPRIAPDVAELKKAGWEIEQNPNDTGQIAFLDPETQDLVDAQTMRDTMNDTGAPPIPESVVAAAENVEAHWYAQHTSPPTKFSTYQLPGGENYRELLLTLPRRSTSQSFPEYLRAYRKRFPEADTTDADVLEFYDRGVRVPAAGRLDARPAEDVFKSSHFDQPNILAHIRFNERTDADGKRVLFIEEIQSDWAQKGKKEGFAQQVQNMPELLARAEYEPAGEGSPNWRWRLPDGSGGIQPSREAAEAAAAAALNQRTRTGIPAAPFVGKTDAWVALSMKRMIAYAAENGFDRVAWTRGEQQVERYTSALRKAVDVIEWKKTPEGVQLVGYRGSDAPVQIDAAIRRRAVEALGRNDMLGFDDANEALHAIEANRADWQERWDVRDQNDITLIEGYLADVTGAREAAKSRKAKVVDTTEKEDALSDAIGKAMADKIINDPNQTGTIEGEGIRIDSTGMAGFYDRIVPKVANDVLKKLGGGRVVETEFTPIAEPKPNWAVVPTDSHTGQPGKQQSFDITPAMKAKVEGGLPLFQKTKGAERGYMSMGEEGRVIGLLENADASTFVHESGHFFLDTMAEIGKLPDVPAAVRADLDTALQWAGLKDPGKWPEMSLDEKRPYHEKFARGFEQYLRDGEAPSAELKGVFQRFRDWLVEIYKSAKSLNVKLNDDIRGVLNRMLADQVSNPSTEPSPAPAGRVVPPPPLGEGGEAPGTATGTAPIDRPEVRTILQGMADNETGWAQIGGRLMDVNELGTGKPSFTTWIPKAEWWRDRPDKKMNGPQAQEAVRKAMAGEKLKPIEQRIVDHMVQMADERTRGIDRVGGEEEYQALGSDALDEGLEPTTENVVDLDLVARATALDEARVERAAMMYENDDAAFRGELEMLIHEHTTEQAAEIAGRSKAGEQPAPGARPAAGEKTTPADFVRNEADLIVEKNPDMPITVGMNPDGTPMTMSAREFLETARAEAELNRQDIPLLEVAAQCLFGKY